MDPSALPLRDVHLPPPVGWWPPAPGWWLIALATLLLAVAAALAWRRSAPRRRLRREALAELERVLAAYRAEPDRLRLLQGLSAVLRRTAIARWGRAQAARPCGEAWATFLARAAGGRLLDDGEARLLADAPYRADAPSFDAEALAARCREWVRAVTGRDARVAP